MKHLIIFYGPTGSGKSLISRYMRNYPSIIIYSEYSTKFLEKEVLKKLNSKRELLLIIETRGEDWKQLIEKLDLSDIHVQVCKTERVRKNEHQ